MGKRLLAVVLVQACGLSLVQAADPAEENAVQQLVKHQATITRDERLSGRPVIGVDLHACVFLSDRELKPLLTSLPHLRTLALNYSQGTDLGLKEVAKLKTLQALDLTGCNHITDAGLKPLTALEQLQTLELHHTEITDIGLKHLAPLKSLQNLGLSQLNVTDRSLKHLAGLNKLRTLNLSETKITDAGLKELGGLNELRALDLRKTGITDAGLKELAALNSLQMLGLSDNKITDAGLKELLPLKEVEILGLNYTQVTDQGVKTLVQLKNLRELYLDTPQTSEEGLKELTALKRLQRLRMPTRWNDNSLQELTEIKSLQVVYVGGNEITDETLAALRRVPVWHLLSCASASPDLPAQTEVRPTRIDEILSLDLTGTSVTDEGLKELAILKNLQTLALDSDKITAAGLKVLAALKHLRTLTYNPILGIKQDVLKGLTALPNLRTLNLSEERFPPGSDETLRTLRSINMLHTLPHAQGREGQRPVQADDVFSFDMSRLSFSPAGLKELAAFKNLRLLKMSEQGITDDELRALHAIGLLHALDRATDRDGSKRPSSDDDVVSLDLSSELRRFQITDAVLPPLLALKNLRTLNLRNCSITDAGVKQLTALRHLEDLNLTDTLTTDAALKDLVLLKELRTLAPTFSHPPEKTLQALRKLGLLHTLDRAVGSDGKRPARLEDVVSLDLTGLTMNRAGLQEIAVMRNLRSLNLNCTLVADSDLKELEPLRHLESLVLTCTRVTDQGLKELAPLQNLRSLDLRCNRVSDAGQKVLVGFKNLRKLSLGQRFVTSWDNWAPPAPRPALSMTVGDGRQVTDAGLAELRKARPDIVVDEGGHPALIFR